MTRLTSIQLLLGGIKQFAFRRAKLQPINTPRINTAISKLFPRMAPTPNPAKMAIKVNIVIVLVSVRKNIEP